MEDNATYTGVLFKAGDVDKDGRVFSAETLRKMALTNENLLYDEVSGELWVVIKAGKK